MGGGGEGAKLKNKEPRLLTPFTVVSKLLASQKRRALFSDRRDAIFYINVYFVRSYVSMLSSFR